MSTSTPHYEVFALRYGAAAQASFATFLRPNPDDKPLPMDFYIWAIRGEGRTIVVDTGFKREVGVRRRPEWQFLHSPTDALKAIEIDAGTVRDVVLTHLDWDHSGNTALFPKASFHLQDAELGFATGRHMAHSFFGLRAEVEDVVTAVRNVYAGRVRFHDGVEEIAPGITVHLVGGHTAGMQVVRVPTARGWVVLASDASHYWANIRRRSPSPLVLDVGRMLEGFRIIEELADGPDHIIPGHDPEVLTRFPTLPGHPDIVRLDQRPG